MKDNQITTCDPVDASLPSHNTSTAVSGYEEKMETDIPVTMHSIMSLEELESHATEPKRLETAEDDGTRVVGSHPIVWRGWQSLVTLLNSMKSRAKKALENIVRIPRYG